MRYPWLDTSWERLTDYVRRDRVPHALLLNGPAGLGKLELARDFVQLLLCQAPHEQAACGRCSACTQYLAGSYPDFHEITFEEDDRGKLRSQIVVEQIRRLSASLALTSRQGGWKIALLQPADAMNVNAANSLLKTLEEPPERSLLLLVTDRPAALPATIRSRCQQMQVKRPDPAIAADWLQEQGVDQPAAALAYAGNAPLRARDLVQGGFMKQRRELLQRLIAVQQRGASVVTVAGELESEEPARIVEFLEAITEDLAKLIQLPEGDARMRNPDLVDSLKTVTESVDLVSLHRYREMLREARRLVSTPANPRLLVESLLLPWAAGMKGGMTEKMLDRLLEG